MDIYGYGFLTQIWKAAYPNIYTGKKQLIPQLIIFILLKKCYNRHGFAHIHKPYDDYYDIVFIFLFYALPRLPGGFSMKFICTQTDLFNGLSIVSKAVPSRTTMTILECVLIDTTKDRIQLLANNMEMAIETVVDGDILEPGIIAIDAKIFLDIVRNLEDSDVVVEWDEEYRMTISCEKSHFTLMGNSGEDFSYLPSLEKEESIILSHFTLKELIRQTIFSTMENENNKMMSGVLFDINGTFLRVITLDGHRISLRKTELRAMFQPRKAIVPAKNLNEVMKIISSDTGKDLTLSFSPQHVLFEFAETKILSRLMEGNYYNVDSMLTQDYETKVVLNKKDFLSCINRANLLIKEGDKKPVVFQIGEDIMELSIQTSQGRLREDMEVQKSGKDLTIRFNPKFFTDALRVIDDEEISLYMVNPKAPCIIRNEDSSYLYFILPVNYHNA